MFGWKKKQSILKSSTPERLSAWLHIQQFFLFTLDQYIDSLDQFVLQLRNHTESNTTKRIPLALWDIVYA